MSKTKIVLGMVITALIVYFGFASDMFRSQKVNNFESCVAYGNLVMESYPRQCRDKSGNSYTEVVVENNDELVKVSTPTVNARVTSPLVVKGEARGFWFFEASFPISLVDEKGKSVGEKFATADGDWMTEKYVPFSGEINFTVEIDTPGFVVFKKDNPSGDPERDAEIRVPVIFVAKASTTPIVSPKPITKKCIIGGCSSQLCTDSAKGPMMSTCEYREEYACYKSAVCEVQATGECGWRQTPALSACLGNTE
jgi:hypothetical protein